jgi:MoaA/NifB/PqqE/SkfB family radical SAM enzyme
LPEYRAKKLGEHWLKIGPTECGRHYCQSKFHITYDGRVLPCAVLYDFEVGNVNDQPLAQILPECADRDVCWGCRANAYFYKGDIAASDPMCWRNDECADVDLASGSPPCPSPTNR